jgi:hypothetical protein
MLKTKFQKFASVHRNSFYRTFANASAAINAIVGVDYRDFAIHRNSFYRAGIYAGFTTCACVFVY